MPHTSRAKLHMASPTGMIFPLKLQASCLHRQTLRMSLLDLQPLLLTCTSAVCRSSTSHSALCKPPASGLDASALPATP